MMNNELVNFETAKLAKSKGFEEPCHEFHHPRNGVINDCQIRTNTYMGLPVGYGNECCTAPTQSLLQRWLREKHGIHLQMHIMFLEFDDAVVGYNVDVIGKNHNATEFMDTFTTYEEAIELGLMESLKML